MFSRRSFMENALSISGLCLLPKINQDKIWPYPPINLYTINLHCVYKTYQVYPEKTIDTVIPRIDITIGKEKYSIGLVEKVDFNISELIKGYNDYYGEYPNTIITFLYKNRSNILTGIFDQKDVEYTVKRTNSIHKSLHNNKSKLSKYLRELKYQ